MFRVRVSARSGSSSQSNVKKSRHDYTKPVQFVSASTTDITADDSDDEEPNVTLAAIAKLPTHRQAVRFVASANPDEAPKKNKRPKKDNNSFPAASFSNNTKTSWHQQSVNSLPAGGHNGFILLDTGATKSSSAANLLQGSAARQNRSVVAKMTKESLKQYVCNLQLVRVYEIVPL